MADVVAEFLADMKSVNLSDSLSGLLAERIESDLNQGSPGRSFLTLLKPQIRNGVYWKMIGEDYCKFGNDFARGLEYLRHYGFCQVSTNPVLAAKAFDEDGSLAEQLKGEVSKHDTWKQDPEAHADEIAMAATLIALWPNLSIFRPLAVHTDLKDYMVSFQLNPNVADQAEASVEDARNAYRLAADYLEGYDRLLGLGDRSGRVNPNIVFKVAASHEAARKITTTLNSNAIGSNNTVVYTVAQEVQLILDAFEGKAHAAKAGGQVVRTYETNMGGRFVSHLREVEAEKIFLSAAARAGEGKASELLDALAADLDARDAASGSFTDKARDVCNYKYPQIPGPPHRPRGRRGGRPVRGRHPASGRRSEKSGHPGRPARLPGLLQPGKPAEMGRPSSGNLRRYGRPGTMDRGLHGRTSRLQTHSRRLLPHPGRVQHVQHRISEPRPSRPDRFRSRGL